MKIVPLSKIHRLANHLVLRFKALFTKKVRVPLVARSHGWTANYNHISWVEMDKPNPNSASRKAAVKVLTK